MRNGHTCYKFSHLYCRLGEVKDGSGGPRREPGFVSASTAGHRHANGQQPSAKTFHVLTCHILMTCMQAFSEPWLRQHSATRIANGEQRMLMLYACAGVVQQHIKAVEQLDHP